MLRFSLLTLFFAFASAKDFLTDLAVQDIQRRLEDVGGFDVDAFQFNFAGINVNAALAQEKCPDQWGALVQCVITDCPTFQTDCPDIGSIEIPQENIGTVGTSCICLEYSLDVL